MRITHQMIDLDAARDRIISYFNLATPEERRQGSAWYDHAHQYAADLAGKHDTDLATAAAVISALSPGTTWERNLIDAADIFTNGHQAIVSTYTRNKAKALAIIAGEIEPENAFSMTTGPKTRQFWCNIVSPGVAGPVTIDRHCTRAAMGSHLSPDEAIAWVKTPLKYGKVETAYHQAADLAGLLPQQLQAIVWLVFKRLHSRKYTATQVTA